MMPRVAILISGRGSNMVTLAQAAQNGVLAGRCEIAAVVSSRPAAPGLDRARELGLATFALDARQLSKEAYAAALLAVLENCRADVVVLAGYMRLLSPRVVARYRGRILNIHPADTARHQGLHGYEWAFNQRLPATRITVHLVDEGLDTGRVLAQREVDLRGAETLAEVERRGLAVEHQLYPEALKTFLTTNVANDANRNMNSPTLNPEHPSCAAS